MEIEVMMEEAGTRLARAILVWRVKVLSTHLWARKERVERVTIAESRVLSKFPTALLQTLIEKLMPRILIRKGRCHSYKVSKWNHETSLEVDEIRIGGNSVATWVYSSFVDLSLPRPHPFPSQ